MIFQKKSNFLENLNFFQEQILISEIPVQKFWLTIMVDLRLDSSKIRKVRILEKFCNHVLTPQEQSSERHLPGTIVP